MALLYRCCYLLQSHETGSFCQQLAAGIGESAGAAASYSVGGKNVLQFLAEYSRAKHLGQTGNRILDYADSARNSCMFRAQNLQLPLNPPHDALNILERDARNLHR
jgi:hypothetical protein